MTSGTWIPWEREKQNIWVREMPDSEYVINQDNVQFQFKEGDMDYKVQTNFSKWFSKEYGKTAVVVGIRASESLHRYVAVSKDDKKIIYDGKKWCSVIDKNTVNAYPIYDWETSDIWTANAKFEWDYNKLYDLYYQAGLTIDKMRVASPFNDCASETLKLYKVIDPKHVGKMVSRVNGVNFTGIYGGTTAMGWKSITLPKGHTWKSYLEFLLNTLDEDTRSHYIRIFNTSFKYGWKKGEILSIKTCTTKCYRRTMSKSKMYVRQNGIRTKTKLHLRSIQTTLMLEDSQRFRRTRECVSAS